MDVTTSVERVAKDLSNTEICADEASKLVRTAQPSEYLPNLIEFAQHKSNFSLSLAAIRLVLAMEPFPLKELMALLTKETDSRKKAYILWMLDNGVKTDAEYAQLRGLAVDALADERSGIRMHAGAETFARDGLQVCDIAYNLIVRHDRLTNVFQEINPGSTPYLERAKRRDTLFVKLGLPIPDRNEIKSPSSLPGDLNKSVAQNQDENWMQNIKKLQRTSSRSFVILLGIVVCALGLLWLFLQKRKSP